MYSITFLSLTAVVCFYPKRTQSLVVPFPSSAVRCCIGIHRQSRVLTSALFSTTEDKTDEDNKAGEPATMKGEVASSVITTEKNPDAEGLTWWWEVVWDLDIMQVGKSGEEISFGDSANVLRTNIEQIYGGFHSLDGCPLAEGELADIGDGTMFIVLQNYYRNYGSPYKLCLGPKSSLVISDPVQHTLKDANTNYDKDVLAEILEPIMGKGLIRADLETWSIRRRQIVPAFHKLEHIVGLFGYCNQPLIDTLNKRVDGDGKVEMESLFCSVALDIIGLSVFNYEFGSVTQESPVIKAVYYALEHRSMTPAPYWNLPLVNQLVPRLRKFNSDLKLLNDVLDDLITRAKQTRTVEEELENRNYNEVQDHSLLRFLVDMRGADTDNIQLRLMTMLIAGHETTAAVLTWALFELTKNPEIMKELQDEIDEVVGDRMLNYEDKKMKFLRLVVAETLRMYPEPPLLIRRCRTPDELGAGREAKVIRGMDIFMAVYNIHRDERFWPSLDTFDPLRFTRSHSNPDFPGWAGFDPKKWEGKLYPNEVASDFAFLPFGGGARKCVGDEFAILEATVTLAMVFEFSFDESKFEGKDDILSSAQGLNHPVGMRTGATIHTRNGLHLVVEKRGVAHPK
uniref:Carotenoid hydroxylase CYP97B2 n=1 Tax=Phaeodactylum tricornutum TaxID=2850 RepID=A0A3S7L8P2_PHATR|nr:Carotenoid hydroxylase CYP97B2 [Phaeodactylum tricornutum]QDL56928.1 P450 carotenoid hydroxylase CYP97B2 [Phaeodactylum tricornutum]